MKKAQGNKTQGKGKQKTRPIKPNRLEAMQHPIRAKCLRLLIERGVMSPAEVSRELPEDLGKVSYHMRRLRELDCAEIVKTRPVRGALEHFYRATERHFLSEEEWEQLDQLIADDILGDYMRLVFEDFVASREAGIVGSDGEFHITRTPVPLDHQGVRKVLKAAEELRLLVSETEKESAERRHTSGEPAIPCSFSIIYFKMPRQAAAG